MMITACFLLTSLLAGIRDDLPPVCDHCGVRFAAIDLTVARLKESPRPHDRKLAAEGLARVNWICHPEAVHALADALRFDPKDDVREAAAESLGRMGACDPDAHFVLRKAAVVDRDLGVRKKSRKALASLPHRCIDDCVVCGPAPVSPSKRMLSDGSTIVPGSERIVEIAPPGVLELVEPSPRVISVAPEDAPPPPPTPVFVPPIRTGRNLPPTRPIEVDAPVRRSSAKPVSPPIPSDLPPLEGPAR